MSKTAVFKTQLSTDYNEMCEHENEVLRNPNMIYMGTYNRGIEIDLLSWYFENRLHFRDKVGTFSQGAGQPWHMCTSHRVNIYCHKYVVKLTNEWYKCPYIPVMNNYKTLGAIVYAPPPRLAIVILCFGLFAKLKSLLRCKPVHVNAYQYNNLVMLV